MLPRNARLRQGVVSRCQSPAAMRHRRRIERSRPCDVVTVAEESRAIGCRPDLPITNDGLVECRLLGAAAEVNPGSDAAGWRFVLNPPPDFRVVKAFRTRSKVGGVSKVGRGQPIPRVPVGAKTQSCNGHANRASSTLARRALGGKHYGSHRKAQTGELARQTVAADDGGGRAAARLCSSCRVSAVGKGRKEPSPRKRGGHGAATNKRAADLYARSLAPATSSLRCCRTPFRVCPHPRS